VKGGQSLQNVSQFHFSVKKISIQKFGLQLTTRVPAAILYIRQAKLIKGKST
jgi:hypothetical protein